MEKLPYMQFYPSDWLADCQILSLAARGAWQTIICKAWGPNSRGVVNMPLASWARLFACTESEAKQVITELSDGLIADVEINGEFIQITCRRIVRDWEKAHAYREKLSEGGKKGMEKRWKKATQEDNQVITGLSLGYNRPEARSQKPESIVHNPITHTHSDHIPTLDEAKAFAATLVPPCPAEVCVLWYEGKESSGWVLNSGIPLRKWKPNLSAYWGHWQNNHREREAKNAARQVSVVQREEEKTGIKSTAGATLKFF